MPSSFSRVITNAFCWLLTLIFAEPVSFIQSKENFQLVPLTAFPSHLSQHYPRLFCMFYNCQESEIYILWSL